MSREVGKSLVSWRRVRPDSILQPSYTTPLSLLICLKVGNTPPLRE